MERLPYIVDGTDFTAYVNRWQYSVGFDFREGSNGGLMLDGSIYRDLLAIKARVSVTVNDQRGPELSALLAAVLKNDVQLTYFDPKANAERTGTFKPTVEEVSLPPVPGSTRWGKGFRITMEEK